jgi:deoxyribodipyrimidine photo-lyase
MSSPVNIFWFRRDLRLHDNAGLYHALKEGKPVVPVFIFDRNILDDLEDRTDRRVEFIHNSLKEIQEQLNRMGSALDVRYGFPTQVWKQLIREYTVEKVFTNHDYEPYANKRDEAVAEVLRSGNISFHTFKDHVIFEKDEIVKDDKKPYTVFTPYSKKWKSRLSEFNLSSYSDKNYFSNFFKQDQREILSLEQMNFKAAGQKFPENTIEKAVFIYALVLSAFVH